MGTTDRPRVSPLPRIELLDGTYAYYSPDGHLIGGFTSVEEREADLSQHFEEVLPSTTLEK